MEKTSHIFSPLPSLTHHKTPAYLYRVNKALTNCSKLYVTSKLRARQNADGTSRKMGYTSSAQVWTIHRYLGSLVSSFHWLSKMLDH